MSSKKEIIRWKETEEKILKSWADKGACYKIMHDRAHKKLWCLNAWFTIPVIIFSTLAGTGNFSQGSFSDEWKLPVILLMGGINILSAIVSTISQFLGVAQSMEGHRISSIAWDKYSRKIQVELAKDNNSRSNINQFLPTCQEEYNRLIENSPSLPNDIIRWLKNIVDTGDYDDTSNGCCRCCYECFCFPFGYDCRPKSCFHADNDDTKRKKKLVKLELQRMDRPEILGILKSTKVTDDSKENDYSIYDNI
jgi:hypothetical protein